MRKLVVVIALLAACKSRDKADSTAAPGTADISLPSKYDGKANLPAGQAAAAGDAAEARDEGHLAMREQAIDGAKAAGTFANHAGQKAPATLKTTPASGPETSAPP